MKISFSIKALLFSIVVIAIMFLVSWLVANHTEQQMRHVLLLQTKIGAQSINIDKVKNLTGTEADEKSVDYLQLKAQFANIMNSDKNLRFVYLMGMNDKGSIFFYVDDRPKGDAEESLPGSLYDEAPNEFKQVMKTGIATVEGPSTDSWGTYASGCAPIIDPKTGKTIAIFAIDFDAKSWYWELTSRTTLPVGLILMLVLGAVAYYLSRLRGLQLRESEEKYRIMFDDSPDAYLILNQGVVMDCNHATELILGGSRDDILGLSPDNFSPEFQPDGRLSKIVMKEKIDEALSLKKNNFDWVHCRLDGSVFWVIISINEIKLKGESVLFVAWTDISELKSAEKLVRESEVKFKTILETSPDGMVISGLDGIIQLVTSKTTSMFGFETSDELIGKNILEFIHSSYQVKAKHLIDEMIIGNLTGATEYLMSRKDGKTFYVEANANIMRDANNHPVGLLYILRDITDRKIAEEKLAEISQRLTMATKAGGVGIWDYDLINNNLLWDDQMFELYGIDKTNFVGAYETWIAGIHPEDVAQGNEEIQQAIKGEKDFDTEFRVVWPDGSIHNIKALGTVLLDKSGLPFRMIGTNWEITEKKKIEEDLIKAVAAAEAASKAKSEFLANMSHEIRTPLNGVIGFTDLLKTTPLSHVQEQYVKNANTSGHTLLGIINDILDFSKIEAGMLDLDITKTDMIDLLGQSVDIIKFAAGNKDLEVLLDIDLEMPRFAQVDAVRLKQILANLMSNSVKFTERGEVELKAKYERIDEKQGKFRFSVRDTGIGISKEQQLKLFKAFSQGDSSTTRKFGGTGLGLIISEMIAKKMGSEIKIESILGKGSTFYFDIITNTQHGKKVNASAMKSIHRCLVIDDNENNRIILEDTMANWGIECVSTDNGLSAIKIIETSAFFDVIICDYHMPIIDGVETIKLIREKLKLSSEKLPIILLHSSSDDAELHKRCDELGILFRLTKPVKSDELFSYLCNIHVPSDKNINAENPQLEKPVVTSNYRNTATILIAEDNEFNMMLVKAIVTKILPTVRIIEAINGVEAVEMCEKEQPDLILMDMQMPEMSGVEATIIIREREKGNKTYTPIVALTAGALKEEQEKCMSAGMDDFLTKPIEQEKLKEVLNQYLIKSNQS